jgi:hypothetical protein
MELNITFDYSKCHGMITKGKKDIHQCSAPKKLGEYCGKHANCKTLKTIYDYGAIKTILEVVHHTEIPKEIKIERPLTELEKIGNQLKEYGYNSIGNIECDKKTEDKLIKSTNNKKR